MLWVENTLGSTKFCGIRDQNFHHVWDQGLKICVKIRDQRRKNISRYDPVITCSSSRNLTQHTSHTTRDTFMN